MAGYMTERQRKNVEAYARGIAAQVGLLHWEIHLNPEPCRLGAWAGVAGVEGRAVARLKIAHGPEHGTALWEAPPEQQRHVITHEMVHLFFENAWQCVEVDLKQVPGLSAATHAQFQQAFARQMEYGIDAVAAAWAPNLPLPEYGPDAMDSQFRTRKRKG
jgi:hypothetical protein